MKKKILCIVLAVILAITPLVMSSCQKENEVIDLSPESGAMTTKDLKNVYKSEIINLKGTDFENLEISSVIKLNDEKFVVNGYDNVNYTSNYYITDINFKNSTVVPLSKTNNDYNAYINIITSNPADGSIWYIKNEYYYSYYETYESDSDVENYGSGESIDDYYLVKLGADGNIESETKINDYLEIKSDDDDYTYSGYVSKMLFTGDKLVTLVSGQKLCVFNTANGGFEKDVPLTDGVYANTAFLGKDGKVYLTSYDDDGMGLFTVDLESGSVNKAKDVSFDLYDYSPTDGELGYDIILSNESGIYGYDMSKDEITEICNYVNSDISAYYASFVFLDGDRILMPIYDDDTMKTELFLLTKVDPSEMKERYVIKVAGEYVNYNLKNALMKFNRTQDEYKVIFEDYSKYNNEANNWEGAKDALNRDIVSKTDAPDILMVNYNTNVESLASKGVFMDIEELMASDSEFNKSDYLENVFEAMKVKGKLYTFTPSANFMTIVGKKSLFGDKTGWTVDEFYKMYKSLGEGESMFSQSTREDIGKTLISIVFNDFVDENTGKCSFNSQEFKDLLEYIKDLPEDYSAYSSMWDENPNYWEEMELSYSKGTTKLYNISLYNFKQIPQYEAYMGEDVTFIGYPTSGSKGGNGTIITTNFELAGIASSKVKAGVWAVFKYLLSDAYQETLAGKTNGYSWTFPIKKSTIEEKIETDLKPNVYKYTDEDGNEVEEEYDDTYYIGGTEVTLRKSTREDADRIYDIISKATVCLRSEDTKTNMIMEEAKPFFDGQKSVDDVVEVINSKMQIYINE